MPSTAVGRAYQQCVACVMDTTDPTISFDDNGVCNHCRNFRTSIAPNWHTDAKGDEQLMSLADQIRKAGRGKEFDCIIGLSGGLDSSFATYVAIERMGLRPLLFHCDAGWNTDQAVGNIERLIDGLNLELYTEVVDWGEMKDLQVAFLRSQIPDQDLVQDAAFFSSLYLFARRHGVKYVLTGSNYSTECCREPDEWGGYTGVDKTLFKDIHAQYGTRPLDTFPLVDILRYKVLYQTVLGMRIVRPLNLVPYIKEDAEEELQSRFGWQRFQHKHHESRFTRFYEDFWLPRKFGFDKRKAHFSSLIMTSQLTREDALSRLTHTEMDEQFLQQEFEYVASKLDLTVDELRAIFEGENKTYRDYKNKRWLIGIGAQVLRNLGVERRLIQ